MDKYQHSTIGFINTSQRTILAHFQPCFMTDASHMMIDSIIKRSFFYNQEITAFHYEIIQNTLNITK